VYHVIAAWLMYSASYRIPIDILMSSSSLVCTSEG
jgi:hypothetical protein